MSVIITNMNMPKGCHECQKFLDEDDYCIIQDLPITKDELDRYTFDKQYKNCPLKSINGLINYIKDHAYPVRYDRNSVENGMTITGIEQAIKEYCEVLE